MEAPAFFAIQPDEFAQHIINVLLPALEAKFRQHEPEQLLTQKEAAAFLHCSLNTLIKWGRDGIVTPIRKGSRVYYRRSDLLTLQTAEA